MFRQAFRVGVQALKSAGQKKGVQIVASMIGLSIFQQYQRYTVLNDTKAQKISSYNENDQNQQGLDSSVTVEDDAIYLNKHTYMSRLLGNKHENYILVIFAEDNYEDTNSSIKTAKHIKKILKQQGKDINVYVISRPTLEDVRKMANRIMDFNIFEREENPQSVEIYIKTTHANDYVYFKWRRESFFTEYKSNKFIKKLDRYMKLFDHIPPSSQVEQIKHQEQQLADILQRQYIKLNEPVIIKCASFSAAPTKQQNKDVKFFKKLCFFCSERKLVPLQSRFIILENKEIMKQLNLEEGQIYVLRNDMVQKLENCQEIQSQSDSKKILIIKDDFMYIPNRRNESGKNEKLSFFASRFESYSQYKNANSQLLNNIDTLSRQSRNSQNNKDHLQKMQEYTQEIKKDDFEEMKEEAAFINFIMPRITFLRDAKFGNIGKLFKKITFAKEKQVLALNLQRDDRINNNSRIATFFKLYQKYQHQFTFLLVDTDQLIDLFPHMDQNQSQFSVFNFFNIDKSQSKVGKYYKHLIFPFEKYFLKDPLHFYEEFDTLRQQLDTILVEQGQKDYVINQQDMIPQINSDILDILIHNSSQPFLVQILDESPYSRLSQYTLNQLELQRLTNYHSVQENDKDIGNNIVTCTDVNFYRMNYLNQHPFLKRSGNTNGPIYLYVDPKSKQVFLEPSVQQNQIMNSREEVIQFITKCKSTSNLRINNNIAVVNIEQIKEQHQKECINHLTENNSSDQVNQIDSSGYINQISQIQRDLESSHSISDQNLQQVIQPQQIISDFSDKTPEINENISCVIENTDSGSENISDIKQFNILQQAKQSLNE